MRIAVCGGTFDPFHRGHLDPVLAIRSEMQWDRVIYVPAWRQPFKTDRTTTSGYHRYTMAALATRNDDGLFVSDQELERGGISYTVDTLEQLRARHPHDTFDWIIGDDNVRQLGSWRAVGRIVALARFVVLTRAGGGQPPAEVPRERIVFARNDLVPVSSTEIRKRVREGQSIDAFVDPLVSRYIHHYGLYKEVTT